jgi:hypothetical protein
MRRADHPRWPLFLAAAALVVWFSATALLLEIAALLLLSGRLD